jgi:hypothetical protein
MIGTRPDEILGDPWTNLTDDQILHAFEIFAFASVRKIAQMRLFPETMIYRHLTESLNFVSKRLL